MQLLKRTLKFPRLVYENPFILFVLISYAVLVYLFYSSELGERVEAYFFDVRTKLKPYSQSIDDIVLITADTQTIRALAPPNDDPLIDLSTWTNLARQLSQTQAKHVVYLLFANVVDFSSPGFKDFVQVVKQDPRTYVGSLSLNTLLPSLVEFPEALMPIKAQVYGVDFFRKRSNSYVRESPFYGYCGRELEPMLPAVLGNWRTRFDQQNNFYALNYRDPSQFAQIRLEDYLRNPVSFQEKLAGKTVLVGYTVFRDWPVSSYEPVMVNTPLLGKADDVNEHGMPIIYVLATAIDNLMHNTWLRRAPQIVEILQVVIVTLAFGLVWMFGVVVASLAIIIGWGAIIPLHAALFQYAHVDIPLADTALFSSIAMLSGALLRAHKDVRERIRAQIDTMAKAEITRTQSSFLDRFAVELAKINQQISSALRGLTVPQTSATLVRVHDRTIAASLEFGEYLKSIQQLSAIGNERARPINKASVDIVPVIGAVVERLDQAAAEKKVTIDLQLPEQLVASTSPEIVDTIVYNFLSNAIKYGPDGSTVTLTGKAHGSKVTVSVKDNGKGIPADLLERIFEKFYRIKSDQVYAVKGTGLGLYLCRYFADQIGAKVYCESVEGRGSEFFLELV